MEIRITEIKIKFVNEGRLRAYATITIDNCFKIRGIRIIEGPNGLYIASPAEREAGTPFDISEPVRPHLRELFEDKILTEYRKLAGHDDDDGDDVA